MLHGIMVEEHSGAVERPSGQNDAAIFQVHVVSDGMGRAFELLTACAGVTILIGPFWPSCHTGLDVHF